MPGDLKGILPEIADIQGGLVVRIVIRHRGGGAEFVVKDSIDKMLK